MPGWGSDLEGMVSWEVMARGLGPVGMGTRLVGEEGVVEAAAAAQSRTTREQQGSEFQIHACQPWPRAAPVPAV